MVKLISPGASRIIPSTSASVTTLPNDANISFKSSPLIKPSWRKNKRKIKFCLTSEKIVYSIMIDNIKSFFIFLNLRLIEHRKDIRCSSLLTFFWWFSFRSWCHFRLFLFANAHNKINAYLSAIKSTKFNITFFIAYMNHSPFLFSLSSPPPTPTYTTCLLIHSFV